MIVRLVALVALSAPNPHALVQRAIAALRNGSATSAASIRLRGIEHSWIIGNAERAEGPWRAAYARFVELYDDQNGRMRRTDRSIPADTVAAPERITILTDTVAVVTVRDRYAGGSHGTFEDLIDRVDGSPLRALRLAEGSTRLRYDGVVSRYGVSHDIVSFPWRNGRMRIELSAETHLPDAVEIVRPYPDNLRWGPFGDVTMRTDNVDWQVTESGAYWPMEQKTSLNGERLRDATYASATFDAAVPPSDSFVVSDSLRAQFAAASALNFSRLRVGMRGQPAELGPGIVRIPDFWSQTLVKQDNGVVIFEAHISAQYLHEVIDEANKRWPGAPIKALVMTSDPWAHLGGVREAMALGLPIYVRASSVPFLTHLASTPHTIAPDSLAKSHRAPRFVPVSAKTTIGTGENRIELYPVNGAGDGERMLMAYFPARRLLYGADLVFRKNGATAFLETEATDLRRAVARERLDVDSVFSVQNFGPFKWADFDPANR
ncbi:MAG TPA: hypothetical protein VN651_00550 [Gemmatimonadaceae bacterium]|nr:hypothetical protein [Gemmatimonadaceae bacterium]